MCEENQTQLGQKVARTDHEALRICQWWDSEAIRSQGEPSLTVETMTWWRGVGKPRDQSFSLNWHETMI